MARKWDSDFAFKRAAELCWPHEFAIANSYSPVKGRAAAYEAMQRRYEGYQLLKQLGALADEAARAAAELKR